MILSCQQQLMFVPYSIYIFICMLNFISNKETYFIRFGEKKCEFTLNTTTESGKEFYNRLKQKKTIELTMEVHIYSDVHYLLKKYDKNFTPLISIQPTTMIDFANFKIICNKEEFRIILPCYEKFNNYEEIGKIIEPSDESDAFIVAVYRLSVNYINLSFEIEGEAEESNVPEKSGITETIQLIIIIISISLLLIIYYILIYI